MEVFIKESDVQCVYDYVKNYFEDIGYRLISTTYEGNKKKLEIQCPENHIFHMSYNTFSRGQRCPECQKYLRISKGEKEVVSYIKSIYNGSIIENDRSQIVNPLTGNHLELDIWLPEINKAIEYNGKYWHSDRQYYDDIKKKQCNEKDIDLLIISDELWRKHKDFSVINNFIG